MDWGRFVHIRAHPGYCLEAIITIKGDVVVKDLEVFIRVQCTERVGGAYDHPSWSPKNVARGDAIKSEKKYSKYKYPDDREDVHGYSQPVQLKMSSCVHELFYLYSYTTLVINVVMD